MASLNKESGKELLDSLRRGIAYIAKRVFDENPRDLHQRGRILSYSVEGYTVLINGKEYTKVPALNNGIPLLVGDTVEIMIPNGQFSQMFIMGKLTNRIE